MEGGKRLKPLVMNRDEERVKRTKSILILLKSDAKNLLNRIVNRKAEYLLEFSLKRTREHFREIFQCRYPKCRIETLKWCSPDVIISLDQFYVLVDELCWYLNHTQDMIKTAEDRVNLFCKQLQRSFGTLELYVDAEIDVQDTLLGKFKQ
ncbi:MAG: hypothetical protein HQK50_14285 [Oligoflexia bacterium]|nr:hypothetical protein [Oligoflexia bacterium]MBF0366738.1 hypothetical protein [Oligoflexia bacterium]